MQRKLKCRINHPNAMILTVLSNDSDIDDTIDVTTVAIDTAPTKGVAVANANGTVTYTPTGVSGADSFTYTVDDAFGDTSLTATVLLDVNLSPTTMADVATTDEDEAVIISVLANDSDSDGTIDVTTVSVTMAPAMGLSASSNMVP